MLRNVLNILFPPSHPGMSDGSLLTRRRMILIMVIFISITAVCFITYNSSQFLGSYDEFEIVQMNDTVSSVHGILYFYSWFLDKSSWNASFSNAWDNYAMTSDLSAFSKITDADALLPLNLTFVVLLDQSGSVKYSAWNTHGSSTEVSRDMSRFFASLPPGQIPDSPMLLFSPNRELLILSSRSLPPGENGSMSGYTLLVGTSAYPFIQGMIPSSSNLVHPDRGKAPFQLFRLDPVINQEVVVTNDTHIIGTLSYPGYFSSDTLVLTLLSEKKYYAHGKSFVNHYYWQSMLFALMVLMVGTLIMVGLFHQYDLAQSKVGRQQNELSHLRERREILDKFHVILDRYLHAGPDTDHNISLIVAAATDLLDAEYALYSRIEDGIPNIVCTSPDSDHQINTWADRHIIRYHPYQGTKENMVIPISEIPKQDATGSESLYPLIQAVLFRSIQPREEALGYFLLFFRKDEPINETNQIVLDLLVNAISGEEKRRIFKQTLQKRDVVLEAIGHSATYLIRDLSVSSIVEILRTLVTRIGVQEAHLFIWKTDAHDEHRIVHDYFWNDDYPGYAAPLSWDDLITSPLSSWVTDSSSPVLRSGPSSRYPPPEREYLLSRGIHSIVCIPITSRDESAGFLLLIDRIRDRRWIANELEALKVAAGLIMATIAKIERDAELREREENFKHFFNQIRDFVFILNPDGRIITANLYALQEIGIKSSDLKGMHLSGLLSSSWMYDSHPQERPSVTGYQERSAVLLTIDGKEIPVEMRQLPGLWNGNQAIFCICKDISLLKRSEDKFASAFRSSQVLHVILNLRLDTLVDVNTTFCDTLGYSRDTLLQSRDNPLNRIFVDDQFHKTKEVILTEGAIHDHEVVLTTRDNECRQGLLYGALIDIAGDPCILYSIVDITARKLAETRIQDLLRELSESNRDLHNFAHVVAHDLKEPLRGIHSLAVWINEDYADLIGPDGQKFTWMIIEQVERMNKLIDGILAYSQAGISQGGKMMVDVRSVVRDVIEILSPPSSITIDIMPDLPAIYGEYTKVQQVFQNIIGNAISHLDRDDGMIRISAGSRGGTWVFEVSDNGPGIDPAIQSTIFDVFTSYPASQKKKGTGIGLSIVKRIVESTGGSVWVSSKPGQGSRFFFTFLAQENQQGCMNTEGESDDPDSLY